MANIAISELDTETTSLGDNDLLLVSKNNGGSYTSAKMKGSVLKSQTSDCQFTEDKIENALNSYGVPKYNDVLNTGADATFCYWNDAIPAFKLEANDTYVELKFNSYVIISSSQHNVNTFGLYGKSSYTNSNEILLCMISSYQSTICLPIAKGISLKLKKLTDSYNDEDVYCMVIGCLSTTQINQ